MKAKPKLLIVSAISPFPKTSGGAIRIFNTIKYLQIRYELYLVFFLPEGQSLKPADIAFLTENTQYFTYFRQKTSKNPHAIVNDRQPYWFSDWVDGELKLLLPRLIEQYQIQNVQLDCTQLLYLSQYLPNKINKIFVAYDISTISFRRRLTELKHPFRLFTHFIFWLEVYFYERQFLPKFDTVVAMSNIDMAKLREIFDLKNVVVIPNGISQITPLTQQATKYLKLGYIGSFNHPPNRNAVSHFVYSIGPSLEKNCFKFKYYLAGDNYPSEISRLTRFSNLVHTRNFINLGQVADSIQFYRKIDLLLAPIFSGSGTRIKILEALSYGVPVITTPVGVEGIGIKSPYLIIVKNPNDFVPQIIQLHDRLKSGPLPGWQNLQKQLQSYRWSNIFKSSYSRLLR